MQADMHSESAASHLPPGSRALFDAARQHLLARGGQWTSLRADLFEELAHEEKPVSAYDVAERLSDRTGRRISANSVYRILDLFVANDLAKRIESRNAYMVNTHPACAHDCIFLICRECGRIDHMDDDSLANDMRARASKRGFRPDRPVLEVLGLCARCRH